MIKRIMSFIPVLACAAWSQTDFVLIKSGSSFNQIQHGLDSASALGIAVHFEPGVYDISSPLTVPPHSKIYGSSNWMHNDNAHPTTIRNTVDTSYLLVSHGGSARIELHNLVLYGQNGVDFSCDPCYSQTAVISECTFEANTALARGIGINFTRHDFSIIRHCNFMSGEYRTAIRIRGGMQNFPGEGSRPTSSTQIKIEDCAFKNENIGISMALVDNVKIIGNDFGGTYASTIDIGGWGYRGVTGDPNDYRTGYFSNISIRDNHFEACRPFVYGNGTNIAGTISHQTGLRIESNGGFVQSDKNSDSPIFELINCESPRTSGNSLFINVAGVDTSKLYVYRMKYCKNAQIGSESFSSEYGDLMFNAKNILYDNGGNTGTLLQANHSITKSDIRLTSSIPFYANGVLSQWNQMDLNFPISNYSAGTLYILSKSSAGTYYSVWVIGSAGSSTSINRVSTEQYTPSVYDLNIQNGRLYYRSLYANPNTNVSVSGVFNGIQ